MIHTSQVPPSLCLEHPPEVLDAELVVFGVHGRHAQLHLGGPSRQLPAHPQVNDAEGAQGDEADGMGLGKRTVQLLRGGPMGRKRLLPATKSEGNKV